MVSVFSGRRGPHKLYRPVGQLRYLSSLSGPLTPPRTRPLARRPFPRSWLRRTRPRSRRDPAAHQQCPPTIQLYGLSIISTPRSDPRTSNRSCPRGRVRAGRARRTHVSSLSWRTPSYPVRQPPEQTFQPLATSTRETRERQHPPSHPWFKRGSCPDGTAEEPA